MKIKIKILLLIIAVLGGLFLPTMLLFAHPGNTDSYGCHTCRTNCPSWGLSYGEYHCHRSKGLIQPEEPIKSHYDPDGGTTKPASEYKELEPKQEEPFEIIDNDQKAAVIDSKTEKGSSAWIFWVIGIVVIGVISYNYGKKKNN